MIVWKKEYVGFESIYGFDEDLIYALERESVVPEGEWQGTLVITMEYIDEEDETNG